MPGRPRTVEASTSRDVVDFLVSLDAEGDGRMVVYMVDRDSVGTSCLACCSSAPG